MAVNAPTQTKAARIKYEASVWLEGDTYVSRAWPLDVLSCGGTEEHASRMLQEAVQLFTATTRDIGTLDEIIEESGYRLEGGTLVPPKVKHAKATLQLTT